jgi:DNA-binding transcriptional MocR family regulator
MGKRFSGGFMAARTTNWEEELLTGGLSARARRVGVAYAGPGAGNDIRRDQRPPIAFTGGIPDPLALPTDELAAASDTVLRRDGELALTYGGTQGYTGLREWLAAHWTKLDAIELRPENFSLTVGSAHALENVCETFVDAGDLVLVEAKSFPGSLRAIRSMGCAVEAVPLDADGLNADALEEKLQTIAQTGRRVKLLYTIPNYHNPTGTTLTLERRHRLIDLCERHDILIIEDDAYGEIGFEEALPPSLYSLAQGRGVVKIGTFSKIIATGLRTGWLQATPSIINATLATRFDMGQSPFLLRLIAEYAANGRLEAHIASIRGLYRRKRDIMVEELSERCGHLATWTVPQGGFFLWLLLNDTIDPVRLYRFAEEEGVAFVGGSAFFAEPAQEAIDPARYVRLAFSYTAEDQIAEGVRRLARAMERAARRDQGEGVR